MRYVRFLKTPRVVRGQHVSCLITITSDLGDSFLPYDLTLSAELLQHRQLDESDTVPDIPNTVTLWKTIQWTAGMRNLAVTLPLSRSCKEHGPMVVRIGTEPKARADEFAKLMHRDSRGVVSAWSAPFNLGKGDEVSRTVERRFQVGNRTHRILEETGESIARHLWDAGVTISCQLPYLLAKPGIFDKGIQQPHKRQGTVNSLALDAHLENHVHVIELGTGCGIVGITLSHLIPVVDVALTDLIEARPIVVHNIKRADRNRTNRARIRFCELDWENPLPEGTQPLFSLFEDSDHDNIPVRDVDLVVAADCTYNADSSPSLVNTISRIAAQSPDVVVAIAMKRRHESEGIFFDLMSEAKFQTVNTICIPLPGDEGATEENVELHVYKRLEEPTWSANRVQGE